MFSKFSHHLYTFSQIFISSNLHYIFKQYRYMIIFYSRHEQVLSHSYFIKAWTFPYFLNSLLPLDIRPLRLATGIL